MSGHQEHNEEFDSEKLLALKAGGAHASEFAVPDRFFEDQANQILAQCKLADLKNSTQFDIPDHYFSDAENRILAAVDSDNADQGTFFSDQQEEILMRIRLENLGIPAQGEFAVPTGYFESAANALLNQASVEQAETRIIPFYKTGHARMWMSIAAAASIAFLAVMIWPQDITTSHQPSFSELLEKTELDENDLEYFATEEEYDELLLSEIELLTDTLITDTLQTNPVNAKQPANPQKDKKDKKDIKPKEKKKTPSFDDLTEEEILEFLLEEGGDDLLDDL